MTLTEFKQKLDEYATNEVSAFMGKMQITQWERDDLLGLLGTLVPADQAEAKKLLKAKGLDVPA